MTTAKLDFYKLDHHVLPSLSMLISKICYLHTYSVLSSCSNRSTLAKSVTGSRSFVCMDHKIYSITPCNIINLSNLDNFKKALKHFTNSK